MISLLAPLLLAKAAAPELPPPGLPVIYPAPLLAAQTEARRMTGFLENCGMRKAPPAVRRQFDTLSDRLGTDITRDRGVWGMPARGRDLAKNGVELFWSPQSPPAYPACTAKNLTAASAAAKQAIAAYEAAYAATTAPMAQGLWIGPLKACKGSVAASQNGKEPGGMGFLSLTFDKRSARALKSVSLNSLKFPLDIWLDGKLLMQPFVGDPLDTGTLKVTSPDSAAMARAKAAAAGPC